jgi:hypothetical protein
VGATGSVGRHAVAAVLEHPDLELAGALVYSDGKAGRDVGDTCGIGPVGVTTTKDPDEIVALDADCVLYMPQGEMNPMGALDDICPLLASGKNVVSTAVTGLIYPRSLGDKVVDKLAAAGRSPSKVGRRWCSTRRSPRTARTKPIRAAWAPPCTPSTPSLRSARLRRESVRSLTFR